MKKDTFEKIYKKVPQDQREQLRSFRSTHPYKHLTVAGTNWEYISCGRGEESLVFLAGGLGIGEAWFQPIMAFENEYRVITPTYPPTTTIAQLVDGLKGILESEGIHQAHLLGTSMGGMVAQCFVRKYPEGMGKLILGNTIVPNKTYAEQLKKKSRMLSFVPLWVLRTLAKRPISRHLSAVPKTEREFWRTYFNELISLHWTKESLSTKNQCIIDFAQNHVFTPDDLVGWRGKILILESDDDQAIDAPKREAIKATYPQAQIHTFHNAGHIPALTRREEYISVIRKFLREA